MWPFSRAKPRSIPDAMTEATRLAADLWVAFDRTSAMPGNINLRDRVAYFATGFQPKLARQFPELRSAPDDLILLTIAQGIVLSGLETRRRVELQLGITLPN